MEKKTLAAEMWRNLVEDGNLSDVELKKELQEIYRKNIPGFAEIVVNPDCMNRCRHCIYPEDYACHNETLSIDTWKGIIDDMYSRLKFRHFIFGGRGMNGDIVKIARYVNEKYGDVKIGMIVEAFGLEKFWDGINSLRIDYLDISVDGLRKGHDLQRNREGAFDLTVKMLGKLMREGGAVKSRKIKKVCILSTLTTINRDEILPMFRYFNSEFGLKNFFIAPVSVYAGRPDVSLKLGHGEVVKFVREAMEFFGGLKDSYVAFNIYEDSLGFYLKEHARDIYDKLRAVGDYFEFNEENGDNEFHFFWYPAAINGCREFIMNTNGDIFTGMVQALGEIPEANIFGNVMRIEGSRKEFFDVIIDAPAFDFFVDELKVLRGNLGKPI